MRWKYIIAGSVYCRSVSRSRNPWRCATQRDWFTDFSCLKTLDGKIIADGVLSQIVRGDRVTEHMTFRFRDGSLL